MLIECSIAFFPRGLNLEIFIELFVHPMSKRAPINSYEYPCPNYHNNVVCDFRDHKWRSNFPLLVNIRTMVLQSKGRSRGVEGTFPIPPPGQPSMAPERVAVPLLKNRWHPLKCRFSPQDESFDTPAIAFGAHLIAFPSEVAPFGPASERPPPPDHVPAPSSDQISWIRLCYTPPDYLLGAEYTQISLNILA